MSKLDMDIETIRERLDKRLPAVRVRDWDRPLKGAVRRGKEDGTVLVRLSYDDRGIVGQDYEPGHQLVLSERFDAVANLPDLAFTHWLHRGVRKLLLGADKASSTVMG